MTYICEAGYHFIIHFEGITTGIIYDTGATIAEIIEDNYAHREYLIELDWPCGTKTRIIKNQEWLDEIFSNMKWIH